MRCVVTGATAYVGGRLVARLFDRAHDVRAATALTYLTRQCLGQPSRLTVDRSLRSSSIRPSCGSSAQGDRLSPPVQSQCTPTVPAADLQWPFLIRLSSVACREVVVITPP
jgi:hypothetical protein